ncbi:MAG: LCP family protein [Clostridiales Family XIII bacterium]|nr:LCP family protein [Clostridiales Family XIII bacterium]
MREKTAEGSRKAKRVFLTTFLLVFFCCLILFVPLQYSIGKLGEVRVFSGTENLMDEMDPIVGRNSPFFQIFQDSQRVNVLVMGVNGKLTDTIMLGSYDMENQRVDVISVPRDTYFPEEGVQSAAAKKINAVYGRSGAVGSAEAVSKVLMGFPIHYYAVIEYSGVEKIVDAIGGVPVTIPFDMDYEDRYDKPPLKIHFKKGEMVLNGANAVKFLRYRKDNKKGDYGYAQGDIGRIAAQQEFLKSAFHEALGFSLPKVVETTLKNVDSDLSLQMAVKIASKAIGLSAENLHTYLTPGRSGTRDGSSYWFADSEAVGAMLTEIYAPEPETTTEEGIGAGATGDAVALP